MKIHPTSSISKQRIRVFKSIQAGPIQTHMAPMLPVETDQLCLYRSACIDLRTLKEDAKKDCPLSIFTTRVKIFLGQQFLAGLIINILIQVVLFVEECLLPRAGVLRVMLLHDSCTEL